MAIAAGISVAIIAAVNGLGTQLNVTFTRVKTSLSSQKPSFPAPTQARKYR